MKIITRYEIEVARQLRGIIKGIEQMVSDELIDITLEPGEDATDLIALQVQGHCQEPRIFEGDIVIISKTHKPIAGDLVISGAYGWCYDIDRDGKQVLTSNEGVFEYNGMPIYVIMKVIRR
jgi:phage repressor protein C with HTH and peptisase S24 domain